ncbi:DUF5753 domain-containing protein, partial [Nocardia seriolae]
PDTVTKIHLGRPCKLHPPVIEAIALLYDATPDTVATLKSLVAGANTRAWWQDYGHALVKDFGVYLSFESAADRIRVYDYRVVAGLMQTPDYMAHLFQLRPERGSDADREQWAMMRQQRQALTETKERSVLLDESAIRRRIGPPATMAAQLRYLAKPGQTDVRIIPDSAGLHDGIDTGPFTILDLVAEHESIVYLEAGDQGWYAEGSDEVKGYVLSWDRIQAAALSAEESSALRLSIAKELDNG